MEIDFLSEEINSFHRFSDQTASCFATGYNRIMNFKIHSPFPPTGDQPQAIEDLTSGVQSGKQHQTLLGVTGSGKTYTMANVIAQTQKPTLIIAHNKTLAAQLYQEFRDFFPENAVSYFVSYYDYYQPEAYIPTTDTYIEKEATINDEIDKLRLATTTNLLTRQDVIVVSSVSCIYNLGSPVEYGKFIIELVEGQLIERQTLLNGFASLQYERSDQEFRRGTFRIRGDSIQIWPAYDNRALRIDTLENQITKINLIDPISGMTLPAPIATGHTLPKFVLYPAKHYMMNPKTQEESFREIETDLQQRLVELNAQGKIVEAYRLEQKVKYDLEMMREFGFTNGIENYSRYFDGRQPGESPFTLLDHFQENAKEFGTNGFLTFIDESHITLPQIRGMHHGDRSRKETLIDYGFRLPSALDNRPLNFEEFMHKTDQLVYVSATPNDLEVSLSGNKVVQQLIRPTGLIDPLIKLRPIQNQIEDLIVEIILRKAKGQRVLVTTLTKKMAEALTEYLNDKQKIYKLIAHHREGIEQQAQSDTSETIYWKGEELPIEVMPIGPIDSKYYSRPSELASLDLDSLLPKVAYLHSDIETLERSDILDDLRKGVYDVVVGINLLREGLDLPEVSLVAILDADKEGFLRSATSLIQTMGRGARHLDGEAVLYADKMTQSMQTAIEETQRRRRYQVEYNLEHQITPESIHKPIRERMLKKTDKSQQQKKKSKLVDQGLVVQLTKNEQVDLTQIDPAAMTPNDKKQMAARLRRRMSQAAKDMDFELAAILRDKISQLL